MVFCRLFLFLLFLAGITSSLSMLQPAIAFFEEGFGLNRRVSVALLITDIYWNQYHHLFTWFDSNGYGG